MTKVTQSETPVGDSRRRFIKTVAAGGVGALGFPSVLSAASPNERLNVACIGVGGMAGGAAVRHADSAAFANVVGLCDVDANILGKQAKAHPKAQTFKDYRRLLEKLGRDLDAVTVSTPDHMHAPIALAAMELGKHVYCEKPIAHNVAEVRALMETAARTKVVTQMGTQIHSSEMYRSAVKAVREGAIGKVSEAHLWANAAWDGPPGGRPDKVDPVPAHLDWKLWLGVAPERPFVNGIYLPFQWRRWKHFGGGTLGDMGCHIFDPVFSALDLATVLEVTSKGPQNFAETYAPDNRIEYLFAGTDRTNGPIKVTWAEKVAPMEAAKLHLGENGYLPKQGSIMIGDKGMIVIPHPTYARIWNNGEVITGKVVGGGEVNHSHEWINACRGEGKSSTPFAYAGLVTEAVLLGTVAADFKDAALKWDRTAMRFANHPNATARIHRTYAPDQRPKQLP